MQPFIDLFNLVRPVLAFWWIILFAILVPFFESVWLFWRQAMYKDAIAWTVLELRLPREIKRSARAMEQVLTAWHSLRNEPADVAEKYWDGEITRWLSLELASFGGQIHFYLRVPTKLRHLVEAPLFSYYPDVEILEVEDYIEKIPKTMQEVRAMDTDLWGTEMVLTKEAAYPIKSYTEFEDAMSDEQHFDPMGHFLEVLAKLKDGEFVGIQIVISAMGPQWHEFGEKLVKKLKGGEQAELAQQALASASGQFGKLSMRTPGEVEVLRAVENNLSKPAFETLIRFIYISPNSLFTDSFPRRGIAGAFNQYSSLNMNSFIQNFPVGTRTKVWHWPHLYPKRRIAFRQQRLLYNYRSRKIPWETRAGRIITSYLFNFNTASKMFPMSTECLATLYHPPTHTVIVAPHVKRVESRKVGPPAGMPIYGAEGELEKFE